MSEIYQVYNSQNKQYVKKTGQKILANSPEPFEGVPYKGKNDPPSNSPLAETKEPETEPVNDEKEVEEIQENISVEDSEEVETVESPDAEKDSNTFFTFS